MMVLPGYPGTKRRNIGSLLMEQPGKSVTTVKGMLTELAYFKEKVSKRLEDLTNSGIKDADIAEIDDCMTSLTSVDTDQENGVPQQQMNAKRRLRLLTKLCFVYAKKRRYASQAM